jgi:hypothetical protein
MHDGEGRHGRSRPYPSLAGRVLIGALVGAFLGLLELWFIGSGSAPSLAVMAADPNVASASGVSLPWAAAERFQEIVLCTSAGSVAYTVWWLIEQPGTSIGRIALAVGAGALLGALFARTSMRRHCLSRPTWRPRHDRVQRLRVLRAMLPSALSVSPFFCGPVHYGIRLDSDY